MDPSDSSDPESGDERRSSHQEWLDTSPEHRGKHPIDDIAEAQALSVGDPCPLSDCDGEWVTFEVVVGSESLDDDEQPGDATLVSGEVFRDAFDDGIEVLACDRTACPLSLDNPITMSQYVEGRAEMARAGNGYESE